MIHGGGQKVEKRVFRPNGAMILLLHVVEMVEYTLAESEYEQILD